MNDVGICGGLFSMISVHFFGAVPLLVLVLVLLASLRPAGAAAAISFFLSLTHPIHISNFMFFVECFFWVHVSPLSTR